MIYWSKQPDEKTPITIDFSDALPAGETLNASGSEIAATNSAGVDVSADLIAGKTIASPYASCTILAKTTAGVPPLDVNTAGVYRLRFLMITTPGAYKLEQDVELTIREE